MLRNSYKSMMLVVILFLSFTTTRGSTSDEAAQTLEVLCADRLQPSPACKHPDKTLSAVSRKSM